MDMWIAFGTILFGGVVHAVIASYYYGQLSKTVDLNGRRLDKVEDKVERHDRLLSGIVAICDRCGSRLPEAGE